MAGTTADADAKMYKFMGGTYTFEGLKDKLKEMKHAAKHGSYWSDLDIVEVIEGGEKGIKLKCALCGDHKTYTNPSQTGLSHLVGDDKHPPTCPVKKAQALAAAKAKELTAEERLQAKRSADYAASTSMAASKKQKSITQFTPTAEQVTDTRNSIN
jgi:hypothetical protein